MSLLENIRHPTDEEYLVDVDLRPFVNDALDDFDALFFL